LCAAAAEQGARVFFGAGDELASALPLVPLLDALDVTDTSSDPDRAAIMSLLHGDNGRSTADLVAAAGERLIGIIDEACGRGPVVLAIDDLQWADRVTVAVWGRLAKLVPHLRLLLIGTVRPGVDRDELAVARTKRDHVERLSVGALAQPAVIDLVTRLAGGRPAPELTALAQGAAGNPLYLTELVEALARDGGLDVTPDGTTKVTTVAGGVPRSLSAAIENRLGFLSDDTHLVLRAAALLGVRFSVSDLAVVSHRRVAELIRALDASCVAGVLTDADGCLSFRHPFVRSALYEGIPAAVRAAWHIEAAKALAAAGAAVDDVARQLIAAYDPPAVQQHEHHPDDWMLTWLVDNSAALASKAPSAAAAILRPAVAAATGARHAVLVCRLAGALYRAGDLAEAERVAGRALPLIDDVACRTDLHWTLAQCRTMTGRAAESLQELDSVLASNEYPGRYRARLLVLAARARWNLGELDKADELAAATLAEVTGDPWAEGWALHVRTIVCMERGQMRQALPLFDRALWVVRGDAAMTDLLLLLQINRALALAGLNKADEAIAAARQVREQAEHAGHVLRMAQACSASGQLCYDSGDWDDALVEVELLPDELKNPLVSCCDHGIAAVINLHRGNTAAARSHLAAVAPYQQELGDRVLPALALAGSLAAELAGSLAAEQAGSGGEALELLRAAGEQDVEDLLPELVRLAVQVGDKAAAESAMGKVAALAADTCVPHRSAAEAYCRGLLDGDGETLLLAATGYRDAGRPFARARALEAAAVAFAEHGAISSAKAAFSRAVDLYATLGAEWHIARSQASLRPHGIRRGPHAAHRRARTGWHSLTPAEAGVAVLVMEGLSNRQIAERLFLSPRTVATHVSHILGKLGVRTRTDIAREASQNQAAASG
ncbi:MAG TPA: LuxR C-terminal-related transcriptional regulator, partial [Pseudonocardiaceae bacterium]